MKYSAGHRNDGYMSLHTCTNSRNVGFNSNMHYGPGVTMMCSVGSSSTADTSVAGGRACGGARGTWESAVPSQLAMNRKLL